jgi:hypothetical protein
MAGPRTTPALGLREAFAGVMQGLEGSPIINEFAGGETSGGQDAGEQDQGPLLDPSTGLQVGAPLGGDAVVPWLQDQEAPEAPASGPTTTAIGQETEAPAAPASPRRPFSRTPAHALPPEARQYQQQLQNEYDAQVRSLDQQRQGVQALAQYGEIAQAIATNPQFREAVFGTLQQSQGQRGNQAPAQPAEPTAEEAFLQRLAPEDRSIVDNIMGLVRRQTEQLFQERLAPFQQDRESIRAMREESEFMTEYPDWHEYVSPEELWQAKELQPATHLSVLFGALAAPKMLQSIRSAQRGNPPPAQQPAAPVPPAQPAQQPVQRAPNTTAQRLRELSGRTPPPTTPRHHRETETAPTDIRSSLNIVLRRMGGGR